MMILVTGGTGFIGSHTVVELLQHGEDVLIIDNLSNSSATIVDDIERICGKRPLFRELDLMDRVGLSTLFNEFHIDKVIHFAALKAVGESMENPIRYYDNNIIGSIHLFSAMVEHNCKHIVFSSSCTVYGDNPHSPFTEDTPKLPCASPYGWTKSVIEELLQGLAQSKGFVVANLRYFNPIGAHPSGIIGENPNGTPSNLLPYIIRTAAGIYPHLNVYGNDYPTPDGSCVRDYIHVVDLAQAHLAALKRTSKQELGVCEPFNIGTGAGTSVLEVIAITEEVIGRPLPYTIVGRREGDVVTAYADPHKAETRLGRKAKLSIKQAIADMWNYQKKANAKS